MYVSKRIVKCQCPCGADAAVCLGCGQRYDHGGNTHCFRSLCQHIGRKMLCIGCGEEVAPDGRGILQAGTLIPWSEVQLPSATSK